MNCLVLPRLYNISKWRKEVESLKIRDICLLHQSHGRHKSTSYKYCKVVKLLTGSDGLTCTVEVLYFNSPSRKAETTVVDIRRLSLITELKDDPIQASATLTAVI